MSEALKTAASLSVSGSLMILVLFLAKPLLRNRLSKRWQYYIWLAVLVRLLLPLSPEDSPVGRLFQEPEARQTAALSPAPAEAPKAVPVVPSGGTFSREPVSQEPSPLSSPPAPAAAETDLPTVLSAVWLGGALLLLVRSVTAYQGFVRCLRAGRREISDPTLLDRLARAGAQAGVRRPVELWENPMAASPMLLGLFRPRIVLPSAELEEGDFRCTVLHELIHCRRLDPACKWLVQLTVCLHWFNPLVWLMQREIGRACELACDEAVLRLLKPEERRTYGDALLRALEAGGPYRTVPGSVTLGESAELLKERLCAIMKFKPPSWPAAAVSLFLTAALVTGAAAVGAYTGPDGRTASPAVGTPPDSTDSDRRDNDRLRGALLADRYYEEGDIAQFSILFPFLDPAEQSALLERCYRDQNIAFFSSCLSRLDGDGALAEAYAQRAYDDGDVSFFSAAAGNLEKPALDSWISRASEDRRAAFLAVLLDKTGRDGEKDALEEELASRQRAEYADFGVTWEGKRCYYKGQLVRVFLDARPDSSFYTLDMNPLGDVSIKILRDADGGIQNVVYMTEEEVSALFSDWEDEETEEMDTLELHGITWYLVSSEAQLRAIGTGEYGLDRHYMQQGDIQLSSREWVPIGTAERPFTGSYNGNGYEIRGLTMNDPEARTIGLFGVGDGAKIDNVTLRDYDVTRAGERVSGKVDTGPVLARGLNGSRCYDCFLYPKELNGGTVVSIPVSRSRLRAGEYFWLGEYTLSPGDRFQYDVSAEAGNGLAIGFASMERSPEDVRYFTVSNKRGEEGLRCRADFSAGQDSAAPGRFRLFLHAEDGPLENVTGSITLTLAEGDQDFPEIPPAAANDIHPLNREDLPASVEALLARCAPGVWYLIHSGGREYVWYDGIDTRYVYTPVWENGGWNITIRQRQGPGDGYVLLSLPGGSLLSAAAYGEPVSFTEMGE